MDEERFRPTLAGVETVAPAGVETVAPAIWVGHATVCARLLQLGPHFCQLQG